MERDETSKDHMPDLTEQPGASGSEVGQPLPNGLSRRDSLYKRFRVPVEWRLKDGGGGG
jgi:hypothetical protein